VVAWLMVEDTAHQPATVSATTGLTLTTASFSPEAGTLLVAVVIIDSGPSSAASSVMSDTATGSWTVLKRQNTSTASVSGAVEIQARYCSTAPGAITATATLTGSGGGLLSVACVRHARPDTMQKGNVNGAAASGTQTPALAVAATVLGSRIYGGILRWSAATGVTMNAQTTQIATLANATNGTNYTSCKGNADNTAVAAVTYGATDAASTFQLAFAEIQPLWDTAVTERVAINRAVQTSSWW
jgi:hypothetical protein